MFNTKIIDQRGKNGDTVLSVASSGLAEDSKPMMRPLSKSCRPPKPDGRFFRWMGKYARRRPKGCC